MSQTDLGNTRHRDPRLAENFPYTWRKTQKQGNQPPTPPINSTFNRTLSILYEHGIKDGYLAKPNFAIDEDYNRRLYHRSRSRSPERIGRARGGYRQRGYEYRSRCGVDAYEEISNPAEGKSMRSTPCVGHRVFATRRGNQECIRWRESVEVLKEDGAVYSVFAPRRWSEMVEELVRKHESEGPLAGGFPVVERLDATVVSAVGSRDEEGDTDDLESLVSNYIDGEGDLNIFDDGYVGMLFGRRESRERVETQFSPFNSNERGYPSIRPHGGSPQQDGLQSSITDYKKEDVHLESPLPESMHHAQSKNGFSAPADIPACKDVDQHTSMSDIRDKGQVHTVKHSSFLEPSGSIFETLEMSCSPDESLAHCMSGVEGGGDSRAVNSRFRKVETPMFEWSTTTVELVSATELVGCHIDEDQSRTSGDEVVSPAQATSNNSAILPDNTDISGSITMEDARSCELYTTTQETHKEQTTIDTTTQEESNDLVILSQQELKKLITLPVEQRTTHMALLSQAILQLPREECLRQIQMFTHSESAALSAFTESQTQYHDTDGRQKSDFHLGPGWKSVEKWMALRIVMQVLSALLEPFKQEICMEDEIDLEPKLQALALQQEQLECGRRTAGDEWNVQSDLEGGQTEMASYEMLHGAAWGRVQAEIERVKQSNTRRNKLLEVTRLDPNMIQQLVCIAEKTSLPESDMDVLLFMLRRIYSVVAYTRVNTSDESSRDVETRPYPSQYQPTDITPCFMQVLRDEARRDEQGEARGEIPWNDQKCTEDCFQGMTQQLVAEKNHPRYQNRFRGAEMRDALVARIQWSDGWNRSRYMKTRYWDTLDASSDKQPRGSSSTLNSDDDKVELIVNSPVRLEPLGPCPYINKPKGCKHHQQARCQYSHNHKDIQCRQGKACNRGDNCAYLHPEHASIRPLDRTATTPPSADSKTPICSLVPAPRYPSRPCPKVNSSEGCCERDACLYGHFNENKMCRALRTERICIYGDKCAYLHSRK